MEDMVGKLMEMLNNPENIDKLKNLTGILKKTESEQNDNNETITDNNELPLETINTIMKIVPIISSIKKDDEKTHFLFALKPLLSDSRQHKLDESVKILQLIKILPLLKNHEIF